ncbi:MAG: efflux RND transporter permease subunit [Bacteroidota bacterium]
MNLPKISINNAPFISIMVLILLAIGILSFIGMARSEDPQLSFPGYTINVVYPGTSPEDLEELIADPLEEVIDELDDIDEIRTTIGEGLVNIFAEGSFDIPDFDDKFDEIVREVNTVRPTLPDGIVLFEVTQYKPEDITSVHQFALCSETVSYHDLEEYGEKFESKLEEIPGLSKVEIEAMPEEEVRVSLDFQRMASMGISLQQVIGTLQANNANIPGGDISSRDKTFTIQTTGGYDNLEEIRMTVVASMGGKIVYLKDIAEVQMDYEDIRWKARYMKEKGIFLTAKLERGSNILQVAKKIKQTEAEFKEKLPGNVNLYTSFEQAPAVGERINNFFVNLLQGVFLVGAIILLFLGWRSAVIIITIIPLCVMMALAILNGAGFGLQQISIAALVIALGLLVDNGIVVIENINRFLKAGYPLREAAAKGTGEVGYAIISSTVTTLLAFFPLTQLGEGAGEFLQSLPLTVMFTLIISLLLALTFSPILGSTILSRKDAERKRWMERALDRFIAGVYRPLLQFSLRRGWVILGIAILSFVLSASLFPAIGVSFFPTADKPLLLIEVDSPNGSSIDATDRGVRFVERVLDSTEYVKDYTSNVGHGNPQIYYNRIPKNYNKNHGQILVNFKEWNPQRFYSTLVDLRETFSNYPGANITFAELKNGAPTNAPIDIRIIGEDLDTLKMLAFDIEKIVKNTPGLVNVENPLRVNKTELNLELNREKAGLANLAYLDFDQTVRASLTGLAVDEVSLEDGDEYPMVVRIPFDDKPQITDFNKVYFTTQNRAQVPLTQVTDVRFKPATAEILHLNLKRYASITADAVDNDQTIPITVEILDKLQEYPLPEGYSINAGGEYEDQQSTFGSLGVILILAQVAIFAVLVLQFRSILQPLVVFSAIPLALTGSFLALYLSGWSFSFFAFVGFISLVGIVVNNSIILVDYINQLRRQGMEAVEAIRVGSERRFTPIVLTSVTTILGLVPLTATASTLWSPLGFTIIGGMVSSTLLTLLLVPVLYKWFAGRRPLAGSVGEEELV